MTVTTFPSGGPHGHRVSKWYEIWISQMWLSPYSAVRIQTAEFCIVETNCLSRRRSLAVTVIRKVSFYFPCIELENDVSISGGAQQKNFVGIFIWWNVPSCWAGEQSGASVIWNRHTPQRHLVTKSPPNTLQTAHCYSCSKNTAPWHLILITN